jgi:hypothetical protein
MCSYLFRKRPDPIRGRIRGLPAAPAAATTTATAPLAAAASTTAAALEPTAARAVFSRSGLVHVQVAALEIFAVQSRDCGLGLAPVRHLDKAKAPRLAAVAILDNGGRSHLPVGAKQLLQYRTKGSLRKYSPCTLVCIRICVKHRWPTSLVCSHLLQRDP